MNRRTIVVAGFGLAIGLPGCLDRSGSTSPETNTATEPTSDPSGTSSESTATTTSETSTTTARSTTPELNRTPYPVAWQWNLPNYALGETHPRVGLLTIDNWQNTVNEAALSAETWSFLSETDFGSDTVVAFQMRATAGLNRLILHSVDGVGTSTITLTVEAWQSGSGVNNAPLHLMLLRVPNRGREPEDAVVTGPSGTGTLTSTD